MSSTNRGTDRESLEQYPTPRWCLHRLLEAIPLPGGIWIEPCAGAGNIIKAVREVRDDVIWHVNEIDPKYEQTLREYGLASVEIGDAREMPAVEGAKVIITNPPFNVSEEILHRCLLSDALTIFLQRLNWCGGPRAKLFRKLRPSVYVLPNRPSFVEKTKVDEKTGKKKTTSTDSVEYAFFVFDGLGRFEMLGETPASVRLAEKKERRLSLSVDSEVTVSLGKCTDEDSRSYENSVEDSNADEIEKEAWAAIKIEVEQAQGERDMAFLPQGMADDIANADVTTKHDRVRDGEYTFMHKKCIYEKTQNGYALIIEHRIVSAKKTVEGVEPNAVGTDVSYFMADYGKAAVMLKPNMKAYTCGLVGVDPKDKALQAQISKTVGLVGGPEQLARGMLIRGVTYHTRTKEDEDFMGYNWYPVQGENDPNVPTVLARRKALDEEEKNGAVTAAPGATVPSLPGLPPPPSALPPPPAADPLAGWLEYPGRPDLMYQGQLVKPKAELLAAR